MGYWQSIYWAVDEDGDGDIDYDGLNGFVSGAFPLEAGDPANVFTRSSTVLGTIGDDTGIFEDNADNRVYFLSDSIQLEEGDEIPDPDDGGELPGGDPDLASLSIVADNAELDEGNEGQTDYNFIVTRSGEDLSETSVVDVALIPGDTDAEDWGGQLPAAQTVEFAAGETEKSVTFSGSGDTDIELDESFLVSLEFPQNAVIDPTAEADDGVMVNDDAPETDFNEIDGGDGIDVLRGTDGDDYIRGFGQNDVLLGEAGNDILEGGNDADFLIGGEGDDIIIGGDGEDVILGDGGNDILIGGDREDLFQFRGVFGDDVITDFDDNVDAFTFADADPRDITTAETASGILISVENEESSGTVLLLGVFELSEIA
jgi:Ca2+-binding RTX toxin-like protein